jgi:hypothetical protein
MKGQSSAEALIGVAFILLVLLVVIWQSIEMESKRKMVENLEISKNECFKIQGAILAVYSVPENSQIEIFSSVDFNISGEKIIMNGFNCDHVGSPINKNLKKGNVRIRKSNGGFDVSNF